MRTIFNFLFVNFWTGLLFLILHCLICDNVQNVWMTGFSFFAILTYAFCQVKKIELVRKLAFYLFNPWWKNLIIIVLLVSAGLYFNNLTCFVFAFPLSVVSLFYQFIHNKLWIGIVNLILMLAVSMLSLFAMTLESINPSPKRVQNHYASTYEDEDEIEDDNKYDLISNQMYTLYNRGDIDDSDIILDIINNLCSLSLKISSLSFDINPILIPLFVNLWSALSALKLSLYSALDVNIL